jgi:hypothetical protein
MDGVDTEIDKRTKDFEVVAGGKVRERKHRHHRGEKSGFRSHSLGEDGRDQRRLQDQMRTDRATMEEARDGRTPPQEPQGGDIKPDWQALREHGSDQPARLQGEPQALADRSLTRAQRKELQQVKAEKLFGREPRKV